MALKDNKGRNSVTNTNIYTMYSILVGIQQYKEWCFVIECGIGGRSAYEACHKNAEEL